MQHSSPEEDIVNNRKVIQFWSGVEMAEEICPICGSIMLISTHPLQRTMEKKCTNENCQHNREPIIIHQ